MDLLRAGDGTPGASVPAGRAPRRVVTAALPLVAALALTTGLFIHGQGRPGALRPPEPSPSSPDPIASAPGDVGTAFAEAVEVLEHRVKAAPDDRSAVLRLAHLLHDGHRVPEAVPHYRRAIELDPSEAGAYYDLAAAHAGLGEWSEAAAVLQARIEAAPEDAIALYDLGLVMAHAGDRQAARTWLSRAEKAAMGDPELLPRVRDALQGVGDLP